MFFGSVYPADGTPRAASSAGEYRPRHTTAVEAKAGVEAYAKANPTITFTGLVIDEDTCKVVAWCKYTPRPIIEWNDPSVSELERIANLADNRSAK